MAERGDLKKDVLLFSTPRVYGEGYLEACLDPMREMLEDKEVSY